MEIIPPKSTPKEIPICIQNKLTEENLYTAEPNVEVRKLPEKVIKHFSGWFLFAFFCLGISTGFGFGAIMCFFVFFNDNDLPNFNSQKIRDLENYAENDRKRFNDISDKLKNKIDYVDEYLCKTRWDYNCEK